MAYYNQEDDEQESGQGMNNPQNQEQTQSQDGGAPVQLSNQSSTAPSAAAPGSGPSAPKSAKPASSGMGAGFQSYAKANQGTAQNRLNDASVANVSNQGKQATNAINQATTSFGKKVDAGSLANRESAVSDVENITGAARQVSAAPSPTAAQDNATGQAPAQPAYVNPLDQSKQDRFKEVINAQYKGPESLRQSGLYQLASGKVGSAQNTLNQTKSAAGREEMLRAMYQDKGDYTTGLNKLDSALLNASTQGVQNLQNTAAAQGNLGQKLDNAQVSSANLAQNRGQEIKNIQEQARTKFSEGKKAEEAATEERLASVIKDWDKLPEHFRNIIRNKEKDNAAYNTSKTTQFKDANNYAAVESGLAQAQADATKAQQKLIGFVSGHEIGTPLSLEKQHIQNQLQQQLRDAKNQVTQLSSQKAGLDSQLSNLQNIQGINLSPEEAAILGIDSGEGLYNLGANAIKTGIAEKDRLISRDEQARQAALANLAELDAQNRLDTNLLYNNADRAGTQSAIDALDLAGTRSGLNAAEKQFQKYAQGADITGYGSKKNKTSGKRYYAESSANLGDVLSKAGYKFGDKASNDNVGNADILRNLAAGTSTSYDEDPDSMWQKIGVPDYNELGNSGQSAAGAGIDANPVAAGMNPLSNLLTGNSIGQNISNIFGGGANSRQSKNIASAGAAKDLNKKLQGAIDSSGFNNRFGVANNEQTQSRMSALQALLANMDKTNT